MITSTKNYTKETKKQTDRQNPRTNGKSKAIQAKSHKEACTNTLRKKGKNIYISIYKKKRKRARKSINKFTNDNKL